MVIIVSEGNFLTKEAKLTRLSIRLGGFAGDGLQSTGNLIQKYLNRLGFFVRGFPGTQSTIRGGYVWQQVDFSVENFYSYNKKIDVLIAFKEVAIEVHQRDLKTNGILIYNSDSIKLDSYMEMLESRCVSIIPVNMSKIAREIDMKRKVLINTIAVGVLLELLQLPVEPYLLTLQKRFDGQVNILKLNKTALSRGKKYFLENSTIKIPVVRPNENGNRFIISGNEMVGIAAVASGLKFLAQYPITPASSILSYLSNRAKKYKIVVRQSEDELAAISMIIGASYAGARSMTATSGPGISLMAEAFGYAAMTETPIVLVNAMRAGPSTGVPTKMEQADLNSSIYLSHGESPRMIFAPRNVRECFDVTVKAFNLADKYQMPAIILLDFAISERTESVEPFSLNTDINRGKIWMKPTEDEPVFKRHGFTEDGISYRAFPPTKDAMYIAVGAEHDEYSHSLSGNRCGKPLSGDLREKMFNKRFKKMELLRKEMSKPSLYGFEDAEFTIICWGSTQGAVREVVDSLNSSSVSKWNMISFVDLYPFPFSKVRKYFERIKFGIMFEVNYTGQFEQLIYQHLAWKPNKHIHPLSGENPTPESILESITTILKEIDIND